MIGCLIEKSLTTPEQYPLSLNSLTNACNQKSNREPVLDLKEAQVQDVVEALVQKGLVNAQTGFGSRVAKYKHRFCNTEFSELKMTEQELGITCVLFLRGAQTPGELRTRTNRLCSFSSLEEVEKALDNMVAKQWAVKLSREPGKREARYQHLFSDESEQPVTALQPESASSQEQDDATLKTRVTELEAKIDTLEERIALLEDLLK